MWPDELTVVARSGDTSPSGQDARRKAANRASERSLRPQWSITKQDSLKEYAVLESADASDIEELRRTLKMARDERPLQELFESLALSSRVSGQGPAAILYSTGEPWRKVRRRLPSRRRKLERCPMDPRRTRDPRLYYYYPLSGQPVRQTCPSGCEPDRRMARVASGQLWTWRAARSNRTDWGF